MEIHWDTGIFLGQLVGFAIIAYVIWRYVFPPVKKLMRNQQDAIRTQIAESEKASARLEEAKRKHDDAVEEAKVEASKIREDSRADAQRISEQLREQADGEVKRIKAHGVEQTALQKAQLVRSIRADLAGTAVEQAGAKVRSELTDPAAQSGSVDRFLDELESMASGASEATGNVKAGNS